MFLTALRTVPVVQHACDAAAIERSTAYKARSADKDFAEAWDDALEAGIDGAEREAFRRAVAGYEEPVVHQGRLSYLAERYIDEATGEERYRQVLDDRGQPIPLTIRKHSDALLGLILKGRRKRVYADRTELTGADGKDFAPLDETARAARVAQLMAAAAQRQAGTGFDDLV